MIYHQVKIEEIERLYPNLVIADKLNQLVFKGSEEGYILFTKTIAREILKLSRPKEEDYSDDIFKLELCHSIETVANRETNIAMFGRPWFAKVNTLMEIFNLMEDAIQDRQVNH